MNYFNYLYNDLIFYICRYLNKKDLFNFLITNKFLYSFIHIYRSECVGIYLKIKNNFSDYKRIVVYPKYQVLNNSFLEGIINKLFYKNSYKIFYIHDNAIHHNYQNLLVEYINFNLLPFFNLHTIEFDSHFNQPLNFPFPPTLKHIKFGKSFNQSINELPDYIEVIEFVSSSNFRQHIYKYPKHLKYIQFGVYFNSDINLLPDSVLQIDMSNCIHYNTPIHKLPKNLQIFIIRDAYLIQCDTHNILIYYHDFTLTPKYNQPNFIPYIMSNYIKNDNLFFK
jgi:hypothetical protein